MAQEVDRKGVAAAPPEAPDGLEMAPEAMRELGRKVVELLVDRSENVAKGDAWDGEFRQGLVDQLMELPPEEGRPPEEVIDQAAQEILPFALRHDHPRQFGFISSSPTWPGILADFMAAGFSINQCTWLVSSGPSQLVWRLSKYGYEDARAFWLSARRW